MSAHPLSAESHQIPAASLAGFLAITFGITWGLIGVYIVAPDMAARTFGQISGAHPFFFLAI
jgi:uncharacterized membrane protein YuzA (DUF378 family)